MYRTSDWRFMAVYRSTTPRGSPPAFGCVDTNSDEPDPEARDDAPPFSRSARSSSAVIVTILPSIITKIPVLVWMATSLALRAARFSASSASGIQAGLTVSVFMAV